MTDPRYKVLGCKIPGCESPVENHDTGLCATHGHKLRKAGKDALKPRNVYYLPRVSDRRKLAEKTYKLKRKEHLKKNLWCRARLQGCTGKASQIHHTAKRGKRLNDEASFMAVCASCHSQIETRISAKERRQKGFLK